jgi:DNA-directed RNA polymerase subunit RPC12/RpoP
MNHFPYDFWKKSILESALNEYSDLKEGEGQTQTVMTGEYTFQNMYGLQNPRCQKCKTYLEPEQLNDYAKAGYAKCSKCSNHVSVRLLPDELKDIFGGVKYIAGEDADMFNTNKEGVSTPNAGKPILFTCPSCAGNLEVDGTDRMITCKFCNSQIYLPDDLWLRLHPVKTVERWYLVFDDKYVSAKPPDWYYFSDAAIDSQGNLYIAAALDDNEKFLLFSLAPDFTVRWRRDDLQYSYEDTHLVYAHDSNLYMWDENKHSLLVISANDGKTINKVKGTGTSENDFEHFNLKEAHDLAIDSDGTFIVLKDDKILRYSKDGNRIAAWCEGEEKKGFLSKLIGSSTEESSSTDTNELHNKPKQIDAEYNYVTIGNDGFTYFMDKTSSEDASIAKLNREGKILWNIPVPLEQKDSRPCIGVNGDIYILGKKKENINLIKYSQQTGTWQTLLKDIKEGGPLNEVEKLLVTPNADRFICMKFDNSIRAFDANLKQVYISEQSKEDDEDYYKDIKKKKDRDEE